jgi:cell division protease FtsH
LRVEDPNLASELEEAEIRFSAEALDPWVSMILSWVIPVLLIFVLWGYVFKRMGSASGKQRKGLH